MNLPKIILNAVLLTSRLCRSSTISDNEATTCPNTLVTDEQLALSLEKEKQRVINEIVTCVSNVQNTAEEEIDEAECYGFFSALERVNDERPRNHGEKNPVWRKSMDSKEIRLGFQGLE